MVTSHIKGNSLILVTLPMSGKLMVCRAIAMLVLS